VLVKHDQIEVADRNTGPLATFPMKDGNYDYPGISEYLQRVKAKYPDKLDATVLLEHDTSYDTMVQVMGHGQNRRGQARRHLGAGRAVSANLHRRCSAMNLSNRAKRMLQRHIRHRADAQLNLIPMIDILSVMVSFLLVYSTNVEVIQNTKAIQIPQSVAEQQPRESVVVMITKDELLVQGEPIASVADIAASPDVVIAPWRRLCSARHWPASMLRPNP